VVAGFAGLALEGDLCWLLAERVPGVPLRDALAAGQELPWSDGRAPACLAAEATQFHGWVMRECLVSGRG
jgi:hypothetical protein